jgi:hypothetical protein
MNAAKKYMLEDREPETTEDWAKVVNFWSANVDISVQPAAIKLLCTIYKVPEVVSSQVEYIVFMQGLETLMRTVGASQ